MARLRSKSDGAGYKPRLSETQSFSVFSMYKNHLEYLLNTDSHPTSSGTLTNSTRCRGPIFSISNKPPIDAAAGPWTRPVVITRPTLLTNSCEAFSHLMSSPPLDLISPPAQKETTLPNSLSFQMQVSFWLVL